MKKNAPDWSICVVPAYVVKYAIPIKKSLQEKDFNWIHTTTQEHLLKYSDLPIYSSAANSFYENSTTFKI